MKTICFEEAPINVSWWIVHDGETPMYCYDVMLFEDENNGMSGGLIRRKTVYLYPDNAIKEYMEDVLFAITMLDSDFKDNQKLHVGKRWYYVVH